MPYNTQSLHMLTWEAPEGAPVALLVHGLASSSSTWKHLGTDLNKQGYQVYAPDLYGHGKSPRLELYTLEQWGDSIISLGIKPDLIIGHSMGGLVASYIQDALKADKLVLIDPVFYLPQQKFLLKSIQATFAQVMKYSSYLGSTKKQVADFDKYIHGKRELLNFLNWDSKSVNALTPSPKHIVNRILAKENILIIRAIGSYIAPHYRLKPALAYKTEIKTIKCGHNIHIKKYALLYKEIDAFLKGNTINARNSLPLPLTV